MKYARINLYALAWKRDDQVTIKTLVAVKDGGWDLLNRYTKEQSKKTGHTLVSVHMHDGPYDLIDPNSVGEDDKRSLQVKFGQPTIEETKK